MAHELVLISQHPACLSRESIRPNVLPFIDPVEAFNAYVLSLRCMPLTCQEKKFRDCWLTKIHDAAATEEVDKKEEEQAAQLFHESILKVSEGFV